MMVGIVDENEMTQRRKQYKSENRMENPFTWQKQRNNFLSFWAIHSTTLRYFSQYIEATVLTLYFYKDHKQVSKCWRSPYFSLQEDVCPMTVVCEQL